MKYEILRGIKKWTTKYYVFLNDRGEIEIRTRKKDCEKSPVAVQVPRDGSKIATYCPKCQKIYTLNYSSPIWLEIVEKAEDCEEFEKFSCFYTIFPKLAKQYFFEGKRSLTKEDIKYIKKRWKDRDFRIVDYPHWKEIIEFFPETPEDIRGLYYAMRLRL